MNLLSFKRGSISKMLFTAITMLTAQLRIYTIQLVDEWHTHTHKKIVDTFEEFLIR